MMDLIVIKFLLKVWPFKKKPRSQEENFFLAYIGKDHSALITLPENFNLEQHLLLYPPTYHGFPNTIKFEKDVLYYFLGLLTSIPARNGDLISQDGFIPINMAILQKGIRDYKPYVNYLITTKLVICNNHYIPGKKSKGYKWASKYEGSPFVTTKINCQYDSKAVKDRIKKAKLPKEQTTTDTPPIDNNTGYPYLFHWFEQDQLTIHPMAEKYANVLKDMKLRRHIPWNINRDTGKLKHPTSQYVAAMHNIGKIVHHEYDAHIDTNIHRLHSVLTNLQTDYRNFLAYNGHKLVSIDIKNCQPYLTCLILRPEFWQNSKLFLTIYDLPDNIKQRILREGNLPIMIRNFFDSIDLKEFNNYISQASQGIIYDNLAAKANTLIPDKSKQLSRSDTKELMFHLLFAPNGPYFQEQK